MVCCPHVDPGNPKVGTGATSASLKAGWGGRNCGGKAGRREGKPQLFREEMGKGLGMAMELEMGIGVEMWGDGDGDEDGEMGPWHCTPGKGEQRWETVVKMALGTPQDVGLRTGE